MSKIKFIYEKNTFIMTYENKDKIGNILKKYTNLLSVQEEDLLFLFKGINIIENKFLLNKLKNKTSIIITVIKKTKNKNSVQILNDMGNIVCPECKKLAFLNINEDSFRLDKCINNHKNEFSINEFIGNKNIKENEIKCDICRNRKSL